MLELVLSSSLVFLYIPVVFHVSCWFLSFLDHRQTNGTWSKDGSGSGSGRISTGFGFSGFGFGACFSPKILWVRIPEIPWVWGGS
jgi:hypothetical protein